VLSVDLWRLVSSNFFFWTTTFFSGQPPLFPNFTLLQIFFLNLSLSYFLTGRMLSPVASDVSGYNLRNNENDVLLRCRLRISEKILYTIHCPNLEHEPPTKQMGVKTSRTLFLRGNRSRHHNTEL
jgi:hypothetical protein